MILTREHLEAVEKCRQLKKRDCNDCILFPECWSMDDLLETLEATYAEMDAKEIAHEKARRDVELKLERAIKLIERNQMFWNTSLDARRGLLPEVYLSNKEYLRRITNNG
jgi:hypothetical protein